MTGYGPEYTGSCGLDLSSEPAETVVAVHRALPGGRSELVSLQRVTMSSHPCAPSVRLSQAPSQIQRLLARDSAEHGTVLPGRRS